MRCKRCGQEMKVKSVEVGKDTQGNPIYNDYAFCYECKIKINLDKKKAKKTDVNPAQEQSAAEKTRENELEKQIQDPQEDLSLTRVFEARVEDIVEKDMDYEAPAQELVTEYSEEKKSVKCKPEQKNKKPAKKKEKPENRTKESVEKKPERRPEKAVKDRAGKETQRQHEKKFKEMPEKRVKEVRTKEKSKKRRGKGFLKFLVFVLIMAAIGAALYFNRETVKGWINIGVKKFESIMDKKDDKKKEDQEEKKNESIDQVMEDIDAAAEQDATTNGTEGQGTDSQGTDGATDPATTDNTADSTNADGAATQTE